MSVLPADTPAFLHAGLRDLGQVARHVRMSPSVILDATCSFIYADGTRSTPVVLEVEGGVWRLLRGEFRVALRFIADDADIQSLRGCETEASIVCVLFLTSLQHHQTSAIADVVRRWSSLDDQCATLPSRKSQIWNNLRIA